MIPLRRIQKLTLAEGPWHRLVDRVSLQVQTAGGTAGENGDERTRTWPAPLVRRTELHRVIADILPALAVDVDWQAVHPRAVRREFAGLMIVVVPILLGLYWLIGSRGLVAVPLLVVWALVHAQRTVAALRWGVSDAAVHFTRGWIWRRVLAAPLTKVQVVSRHQTPFDRRHRMATVSADTAGGHVGGYAIHIPYLAAPVARDLTDRLAAAAARTPFRW